MKERKLSPWLLETIFFFLVLGQESLRLSWRTAKEKLPVSAGLQDFYYYYFGDFVNGFVIAYLVDGLSNLLLFRKQSSRTYYTIATIRIDKYRNAVLSALIASLIIFIYELGWTPISTTSDLLDVPGGVLGALMYLLVRYLSLRFMENKADTINK